MQEKLSGIRQFGEFEIGVKVEINGADIATLFRTYKVVVPVPKIT